jgi:hypothetical protein
MTRNQVYAVVGSAFLLLGLAELLGGGCTVHVSDFANISTKDGVRLPHKTTLVLHSEDKPSRVFLDLDAATIVVEGDASVTGIEAEYVVREKEKGDASLAASPDGVLVKSAGGNPVLVVSAKIRVPPATEVDASTALGAVKVSGIHGAASVVAKTDSGRVTLTDVVDVPRVEGETSLGDVTLDKSSSLGELTLSTDSGSVGVNGLSGAKTVTLRTSLGGVSAVDVTASESVTLETDSGSVEAAGVQTPRARFKTDLGSVTLRRSTFDHVVAHSDCGSIRFSGCKYKTKDARTSLGSVKED